MWLVLCVSERPAGGGDIALTVQRPRATGHHKICQALALATILAELVKKFLHSRRVPSGDEIGNLCIAAIGV